MWRLRVRVSVPRNFVRNENLREKKNPVKKIFNEKSFFIFLRLGPILLLLSRGCSGRSLTAAKLSGWREPPRRLPSGRTRTVVCKRTSNYEYFQAADRLLLGQNFYLRSHEHEIQNKPISLR